MKRSVWLLLTALLLSSGLLASCGDAADSPAVTETGEVLVTDVASVSAESESETEYRYTPARTDYGDEEFRILNYDNATINNWTGIPSDIIPAENHHTDILSEAVYTRNLLVEELLRVKIVGENLTAGEITARINKASMSGDDEFDAVFCGLYQLGSLVSGQTLSDLRATDMDLTAPWWDQNSIEAFELGGVLFGAVSDITFFDKVSTYVTFFNTELIKANGLENPYDLYEQGEWTLEKLLEMGEVVSRDVDGNGRYDKEDAYGLSFQNDAAYVLLNAANRTIITKDDAGLPLYNLTDASVIETMQRIYGLMLDSRRFFNRQSYGMDMQGAINMFTENRVLFMVRPIQTLFMMREMKADFGIVTLPKMNATDTYVGSSVNPYAGTVLVIPTSVKDKDRVVDVLQALACESYYTVREPLFDVVLGAKLTRDERSVEMLNIAFRNRVYDIGLVFDFGDLANKLLTNPSTDVTSKFTSWKRVADRKIESLVEQIHAVGES